MTDATILTLAKESIKLCILISGPFLLTALIVGLIISILQAVTQIQEMTLTFVPKILALIVVFVLTLPWLLKKLISFTENLILNIPNFIS
ncbi:flagellar biosynthesis protein FliQ [Thermodesulfobacterium commune]|jgi:flagellar biosynthetic protein FliQ|uniref:Flagellar biosynthetic protein FliQ n=1 Tax=Thermodesulfobacterium commune DSM 2178 TaxID=289377 RepID=A0A075WYQ3_9BACT|nr:flagellar biosynthesis protein FliQ [Thermodesulfobacterium commune]AIH03777.1 flagellar biosynthesis protein FliQ [Thermodesulfobacterium commune DSM 2178]MDK2861902.1 flagellar biosynthesis protein FliQ [Thermodesulfobacterium sp.]